MDKILKKEVAQFMYAYFGNTKYNNDTYYSELIKNYGKKEVTQMIEFIYHNGGILNAFT